MTSQTPPATREVERPRTFPCDQCGGDLVLEVGLQRLVCPHCGATRAIVTDGVPVERDLLAALRDQVAQRKAKAPQSPGTQELSCSACGARVVFEGTLTSVACAYCGTPVQRSDVHAAPERIPVDAVLPFAVDGPAAKKGVDGWVRSRWLAPGDFKAQGARGRLDGVYLPYFSFDAMTTTSYTGERGDAYYVEVRNNNQTQRERRVRWSQASGWFQRFFDDVLVPAVKFLPEHLLRALEPWHLEECTGFAPELLAGKLAHTYDLELEVAFGTARERVDEELAAEVRRRIGGDEQRVHSVDTAFSGLRYRHLLLPVWSLVYRFREKPYRVFVNARTGEVTGERPWSAWKIAFLVLLGAVAAAVAVYLARR